MPKDRVPGVALLKLKPTSRAVAAGLVDKDVVKAIAGRSGVDVVVVRPSVLGWLLVEVKEAGSRAVPDEALTLALVERLRDDPAVEGVSDNKWMRALATANDPLRGQQWPLDVVKINSAWDVTQGASSQRVGVIDTGLIRNHEDFGGKVAGGFDFISSANSAGDGNGRDADFQDVGDGGGGTGSFHGTHVAGTIAAATNNGVGVAGINRNAQLVIVRALGIGGGELSDIMEGALWLAGGNVPNVPGVGANRVSVMNLSLGSDFGCSQFEQSVINQIDAAGVVFVAAAGNSSEPGFVAPVGSPANCDGVVAVAAHGETRALAPYSSFGNQIDIVAPGGDQSNFGTDGGVLSTLGPTTNNYGFFEGTSMAAPHITGIISLMQAIDPAMNRAKAEQLLVQTGQSCNGCGGRLAVDADAAVRATTPGDPVDPDPVDPDPVDPDPVDPDPEPVGADDAFEENDTVVAGRNIACGDHLDLKALPADQDWFDVSIAAGALNVAITGGANDLDLYLVSGGQIVAQSEGGTGDEAINVTVQGSGILQVLVNPFVNPDNGDAASGAYGLDIACTAGDTPLEPDPDPTQPDPSEPVEDDAVEPNDDEASAVELFCAQTRDDLTLTDDDWFFVEVRDGDTLEVDKDGANDVDVEIVDDGGAVLGNGSGVAVAAGLPGGRYLVHVPTGPRDNYSLTVRCKSPPGANNDGPSVNGGCATTTPASALPLLGLLLFLRRRRR